MCLIPANPDISGIGVRVAIYVQNFLSFMPAFYALVDGKVDSIELKTIEDQSTTILVTAFAILISTIVQALSQYGLSDLHTSVILNLSWMNNTNTFIYFILYVHHRSGLTGDSRVVPEWAAWWRHFRQGLSIKRKGPPTVLDDDVEKRDKVAGANHPETAMLGHTQQNEESIPRAVSKMVILLGSCHLTLMAVIGIWLWSSPARFEASQPAFSSPYPLGCTSMSLLGADVRLSSSVLQVSSLVTYSLFLVPGLNLVLPGVVFLALYIHLHRHRLFQQPDPRPRKALLVVPGLLLLLLINLVFMTNTELTIYQGAKQQQPGESQWTFGQTLALLLLSLPIRDTALLEFYRRDSARRITLEKLTRSIALGDVDTVARMVSRQEVNVNIKIKGRAVTALQFAAKVGNMSLVQQILDRNASIDTKGIFYGSALGAACFSGHEDVARLLLERGASLTVTDWSGNTPLHSAAWHGHGAVVQLLSERGADITAPDNRGDTPLHSAAVYGHGAVVQLLLERGADLTATNNRGNTPLHAAAAYGHGAVVQLLLERGANLTVSNNHNITSLHVAARHGHGAVVQLLLERGADVTVTDKDNDTPLHLAASNGHESTVQLLLKRGADLTAINDAHNTPLHCAARGGHGAIVQLLLERGANLDVRNSSNQTARGLAYVYGLTDIVQAFERERAR